LDEPFFTKRADAKQRDAIIEGIYKYLDLVTASGLDILFHQLPEAFFI
jgi:hypothetical protein